jgi:hypothetical protein
VLQLASECSDAALGASFRGVRAMRTTADASALTPLSTVTTLLLKKDEEEKEEKEEEEKKNGRPSNRSAAQARVCRAIVAPFDARACHVQLALDDAPNYAHTWGPPDAPLNRTVPYRAWPVAQLGLARVVDGATDVLLCESAALCAPRCEGCARVGEHSATRVHEAVYRAVAGIVEEDGRLDLRDASVVLRIARDAARALAAERGAPPVEISPLHGVREASACTETWAHATSSNATFERFVVRSTATSATAAAATVARRILAGCTDPTSNNYRSEATFDDNSCRGGRRLFQRRASASTRPSSAEPRPAYHAVRALTRTACDPSTPAAEALRARLRAGMLWAELNDAESDTACHDCLRNESNASCHEFFASKAGLGGHAREAKARKRRRALTETESRAKLEEAVRAHLSKVCCARSKSRPWEPERCGLEYCKLHMQRTGAARMGHTLRRLHQQSHPGTSGMEAQHLVALDLLAPHEHAVGECRQERGSGRNPHTGPSDEECFARSLVHHVAAKHGVDPETVHESVGKFGFTIAELIKRAHDFVGLDKDVRGDHFRAPPAHDAKVVEQREREAKRRNFAERRARKLAEQQQSSSSSSSQETSTTIAAAVDPLGGVHGPSARLFTSALRAHPAERSIQGASNVIAATNNWSIAASNFVGGIHRIARRKQQRRRAEERTPSLHLHHDHTQPSAHQTRPALARLQARKPSEALPSRESVAHAIALVTGSPNSLLSRLSHSASAAAAAFHRGGRLNAEILHRMETNSVADPWRQNENENENEEMRRRRRRLSGVGLKQILDRMHARFEAQLPSGRRLRETPHAPNMPAWYEKEWGHIAGAVDWRGIAREVRRMAEADDARMHWWSEGATGSLPKKAQTGYALLDARVPPSALGRWTRILAHRIRGEVPPWEEFGKGRRLDAAIAAPNPRMTDADSSWWWNLWWSPSRPTPSDAQSRATRVARALETREHRTTTRRLAEAFFEGTLAVPYAVIGTTRTWGTQTSEDTTKVGTVEAVLRYIVYDTALVRRSAYHSSSPSTTITHPSLRSGLSPPTLAYTPAVLPLRRPRRTFQHTNRKRRGRI